MPKRRNVGPVSVRITLVDYIIVNNSVVGRYDSTNKYIALYSSAKWVIGTKKHMIKCEERKDVITTIVKEIEECKAAKE